LVGQERITGTGFVNFLWCVLAGLWLAISHALEGWRVARRSWAFPSGWRTSSWRRWLLPRSAKSSCRRKSPPQPGRGSAGRGGRGVRGAVSVVRAV
jgi:hypothetical protein